MIEFPSTNSCNIKISDEDFDIMIFDWHITPNGYAARTENYKQIKLHKVIAKRLNLIGGIDHEDRDKTNNQRNNLRLATGSQQNQNKEILKSNTSGYKGVYWHNQANKWMAGITNNKRFKCLGLYKDIKEAAKAYDNAARICFGEFVVLNFP